MDIRFQHLKTPYRSKSVEGEPTKSVSVCLAPDTIEQIDELAGPRLRSAWLQRAAELMIALQKGELGKFVYGLPDEDRDLMLAMLGAE